METTIVITDTSVLINFLVLDRVGLLSRLTATLPWQASAAYVEMKKPIEVLAKGLDSEKNRGDCHGECVARFHLPMAISLGGFLCFVNLSMLNKPIKIPLISMKFYLF